MTGVQTCALPIFSILRRSAKASVISCTDLRITIILIPNRQIITHKKPMKHPIQISINLTPLFPYLRTIALSLLDSPKCPILHAGLLPIYYRSAVLIYNFTIPSITARFTPIHYRSAVLIHNSYFTSSLRKTNNPIPVTATAIIAEYSIINPK